MVGQGYTDQEIAAVFVGHPDGIGRKYAERGDPYLRCVLRGVRGKAWAAS